MFRKVLKDRLWPNRQQFDQGVWRVLRRLANSADSAALMELWAATGRYADPRSLSRFAVSTYSQAGEDGILAEIFRRIGTRDRRFVEIGIDGGQQCVTRLLLEQGWRGTWLVYGDKAVSRVRRLFAADIAEARLTVIEALVTPENVTDLLAQGGAPDAFDLLALDIDQHTSHVWRAIRQRARVTCIEYNASLPPSMPCEVVYDSSASWDGTNWFGASLKTMEQIGAGKDLALVGCDPSGINAYFVAAADQEHFLAPFTAEQHYEPPRYHLRPGQRGHPPSQTARRWTA